MKSAPLAQLVEQLTLNQRVSGSSPEWCTEYNPRRFKDLRGFLFMIIVANVNTTLTLYTHTFSKLTGYRSFILQNQYVFRDRIRQKIEPEKPVWSGLTGSFAVVFLRIILQGYQA